MRTRAGPRAGARARTQRPERPPARRPARARAALVGALALAAALAGCSSTDSPAPPGTTAAHPAPSLNSPSPHTTSPAELCTHLITYWAEQELDEGQGSGLDYQEKGLSDGQNEILLTTLAAARQERAAHGRAAGDRLIEEHAQRGCAERYRNGTPTTDPWAQTKLPTPSGSS
ncbi:hypothetical protein [Streptomyces sp. NBC_00083]|uniref:hypothetical protein n=1 Tax=Streptomyces sp. NBC_00083 TaxID=2975647 RepID=UPI00224FC079|nr:hypothetical protein [Streptomyces sp. NBC_00083]MCX5383076.1 hypothetical protein [Streptomyces sp. NBC_00083]